jgi:hypothetical protein
MWKSILNGKRYEGHGTGSTGCVTIEAASGEKVIT